MKNRKYYAEYCPYGVNISYDSFNRNAYDFYCYEIDDYLHGKEIKE